PAPSQAGVVAAATLAVSMTPAPSAPVQPRASVPNAGAAASVPTAGPLAAVSGARPTASATPTVATATPAKPYGPRGSPSMTRAMSAVASGSVVGTIRADNDATRRAAAKRGGTEPTVHLVATKALPNIPAVPTIYKLPRSVSLCESSEVSRTIITPLSPTWSRPHACPYSTPRAREPAAFH